MTAGGWLAFLLAAAVGAPARYLIDGFVQQRSRGAFPWGTLVVNASGCLALGVITGFGLYHGFPATSRTVIGAGGMGAYTTFSTFAFETVRLAEEGALNEAMRNVAGSFVVGMVAAGAGVAITAAI